MSERMAIEGRQAVNNQEIARLRLLLNDKRESARRELSPIEAHEDIDAEALLAIVTEYVMQWSRLRELLAQNEAIRKALGR